MGGSEQRRDPAAQLIWKPQPGPQTELFRCPVHEVLYGGARGGGKTDAMLALAGTRALQYKQAFVGIFFRRKLKQLEEAIARGKDIFLPIGAKWREQKKTFMFPGGGRLKFAYLERDADAEEYQGHNYTDVYFEELTNFPSDGPVNKLRATLRSASGVPCIFRATANPGGPGHQWVKNRYIDPAPEGYRLLTDGETDLQYTFIPAKLKDNRLLWENDPQYTSRLKQAGSENLVRAWLEGDWNVIDGAFFDCWSPDMVLRPFKIPEHWNKFRALDWGSAKPFSVGWWAVASEEFETPDGDVIPDRALVRYREWYGVKFKANGMKMPNTGIRLDAEELARGIMEREDEKVMLGPAGPDIWKVDGGPSIAERTLKLGVGWRKADTGRLNGWDQMRGRMKGDLEGRPMIYCFEGCVDSIRTIPMLMHDERHPEDLDTDGEDHACDEWRFACMSRPWKRPLPQPERDLFEQAGITFNEIMNEANEPHDIDWGKRI